MTNCAINSNDNLLNKTKNQYGDNLTSNTNIQKAAQTEETSQTKQQETASEKNNDDSLFKDFNKWTTKHDLNLKNYIYEQYDYDTYTKIEEGISTTFDFMEGKDADNEQDYDKQTLKLGQGEVQQKDSNNDGVVSYVEYFSQEAAPIVKDYKEMIEEGMITEQEAIDNLTQAYVQAQTVFTIIDSKMGNDDDFLDEEEFQSYYQYMNEYSINNNDGKKGQLSIDDITDYPEFLANQVDTENIDTKAIEKMMKNILNKK